MYFCYVPDPQPKQPEDSRRRRRRRVRASTAPQRRRRLRATAGGPAGAAMELHAWLNPPLGVGPSQDSSKKNAK